MSTWDVPYALVVDDEYLISMHAQNILRKAGFQVLAANQGDAGFELFRSRHSDVVLFFTDVQMPGTLDGFALARGVSLSWPHISIVVAWGHVRPQSGVMPDKARFIAKPFSANVVHAHLQEILPYGQKPEPLRKMG